MLYGKTEEKKTRLRGVVDCTGLGSGPNTRMHKSRTNSTHSY